MIVASIQWGLIGEVILASFAAGLVVVALFALVILGSTNAADARRGGNGAAATGYSVLAVVAFAAFMAIVVLAITTMVNK